MALTDVLIGLGMGIPLMLAVGPLSILLLDQGLERGVRRASPAALGVAAADLSLCGAVAVGGTALASAVGSFSTPLNVLAIAALFVLAVDLGRSAVADLRSARAVLAAVPARVPAAVPAPLSAAAPAAVVVDDAPRSGAGLNRLHGARLSAAFYGLTFVNPLTLVLLASVVVAGGAGVGTAGWALGMGLASLLVHGGFVVAGGLLGSRLGPVASGSLRLGAASFMVFLAARFALGA